MLKKEKYCVGIYTSVSSTKVEQLRSMSNQVNDLIQVINNNLKWVLTDIFMDYKSDMTTKREEFNRMIDMSKANNLISSLLKVLVGLEETQLMFLLHFKH